MSEVHRKIGCVIVLFNPSLTLLEKVIASAESQVDAIYFADNSESLTILKHSERDFYFKMKGNVGIAAAQNEGIRHFLQNDFTHLFFLDQDSILTPGLVSQLLTDLENLQSEGVSVGGISARPFNRESGKKYQASATKGFSNKNNLTEVCEIMNSASLIPAENFREVGVFDEALFIDGVDHEWCWRACTFKPFRFFISEKATLSHYLGEGDRFLLFRPVSIPTPFRVYYQFRNYFILIRRSYVPVFWKIKNGFKYLLKLFYFPLCVKPRFAYLKNIIRGISHGIIIK